MITLPDREAIHAAPDLPLPPEVHQIVAEITEHAAEAGLLDLTYIVIVERGDDEETVAKEIGFSPVTNPIDGIRFDQPGFQPYWAHLRDHVGWYELIHTVSNDGFAFVLLIDAAPSSDLTAMCQRYIDMVPL